MKTWCTKCKIYVIRDHCKFCPECGTRLVKPALTRYECSRCKAEVNFRDKFCPYCGVRFK